MSAIMGSTWNTNQTEYGLQLEMRLVFGPGFGGLLLHLGEW